MPRLLMSHVFIAQFLSMFVTFCEFCHYHLFKILFVGILYLCRPMTLKQDR